MLILVELLPKPDIVAHWLYVPKDPRGSLPVPSSSAIPNCVVPPASHEQIEIPFEYWLARRFESYGEFSPSHFSHLIRHKHLKSSNSIKHETSSRANSRWPNFQSLCTSAIFLLVDFYFPASDHRVTRFFALPWPQLWNGSACTLFQFIPTRSDFAEA